MNYARFCAAGSAALVIVALSSFPAAAQFPPEGAVADPTNPQIAIRDIASPIGVYHIVTKYYYDCTKKRWVLVSFEWKKGGTSVLGGAAETIPAPKGQEKFRPASSLPSGPPPGAKREAGDPDRASNPTIGQNFAFEDGKWIDVKTGQAVTPPNLCPDPPARTTPPTTKSPPKHTTKESRRTTSPPARTSPPAYKQPPGRPDGTH